MSARAGVLPVDELTVVQEAVRSYIVPAGALVARLPHAVPAGDYVARLESGGVGGPSFVVLPLADGSPAENIILAGAREVTARSPRYVRVAIRSGAVVYRLRMPPAFTGWASHD